MIACRVTALQRGGASGDLVALKARTAGDHCIVRELPATPVMRNVDGQMVVTDAASADGGCQVDRQGADNLVTR